MFDDTESHLDSGITDELAPASTRSLSAFWDVLAYESGLAAGAVTGSLRAAPHLVAKAIRHPAAAVSSASSTIAFILRTARPLRSPGSPIMINRSRIRRLAVHQVPKETLHRPGEAAGGTLNDAFVAAVTGGLRRYHDKHGASVGDLVVTMPISIRTSADPMGGNRATLMRFDVPAAIADPAQRIRAIHALTVKASNEKSMAYTQLIAGALNLAPRWYVGSALRNVDFVASDVPGFPMPVLRAGAAVRMQYAFSPTIGAGLNVTLLSYVNACAIGINVDTVAIPDVEVFHDCLAGGFDEVLALAN